MQDDYTGAESTFDEVMLSHIPYYVYDAVDTRKLGIKPRYTLQCAFRHRDDAELFVEAAKAKSKDAALGRLFKIEDNSINDDEVIT